jgi:Tfp pilus assembly protein FimV
MKSLAIAALSLVLAAPVVSIPTPSDAQVMVGRGNARGSAPRRPALSERERERLAEAEDAVWELEEQIADIEAAEQPTPEQATQLSELRERLERENAVVERLTAKRDRRS